MLETGPRNQQDICQQKIWIFSKMSHVYNDMPSDVWIKITHDLTATNGVSTIFLFLIIKELDEHNDKGMVDESN